MSSCQRCVVAKVPVSSLELWLWFVELGTYSARHILNTVVVYIHGAEEQRKSSDDMNLLV
jgi:hypothetical protein